MKSIRYHRISL